MTSVMQQGMIATSAELARANGGSGGMFLRTASGWEQRDYSTVPVAIHCGEATNLKLIAPCFGSSQSVINQGPPLVCSQIAAEEVRPTWEVECQLRSFLFKNPAI